LILFAYENWANNFSEWEKELEKSKKCKENGKEYSPSLLKALIRQFGAFYAFLGIFTVLEECILRIFQPMFMGKILSVILFVIS
jgi:hypothetical protein